MGDAQNMTSRLTCGRTGKILGDRLMTPVFSFFKQKPCQVLFLCWIKQQEHFKTECLKPLPATMLERVAISTTWSSSVNASQYQNAGIFIFSWMAYRHNIRQESKHVVTDCAWSVRRHGIQWLALARLEKSVARQWPLRTASPPSIMNGSNQSPIYPSWLITSAKRKRAKVQILSWYRRRPWLGNSWRKSFSGFHYEREAQPKWQLEGCHLFDCVYYKVKGESIEEYHLNPASAIFQV